jgi:putative phage-type endonuclease
VRRRAAVPDSAARQRTPGWIDARRESVSASDIPILTLNSPYRSSPVDLWAYKTHLLEVEPPDPELEELWDLGIALEPVIAQRYTARTRRPLVARHRLVRHPEVRWHTASLDRVSAVKGERRVVELKWAPHRRWLDGPEPVPPHVQDQVQWQLYVTGWDVADVAVLNGATVEVHELERDDAYIADLVGIAGWFHEHVRAGTMPPVDGSEATTRALRRLRPRDDGTMLDPTPELEALMRAWRILDATIKRDGRELARIKNVVRTILDTAGGSRGTDWTVYYRKPKDHEETAWKAEAADLRAWLEELLEGMPSRDEDLAAIHARHTTTKEGTRSLHPYWRGEAPAIEEGTTWT